MAILDLEARWPELFNGLTPAQSKQAREILAGIWHEGWEPERETTELLTRAVRGDISTADALVEARERARLGDQADLVARGDRE